MTGWYWTPAFSQPRQGRVPTYDTRASVGNKEKGAPSREEVEFYDILFQSVVEGMTNVLGQGGMRATLYHLGLDRFCKHPKELHEGLRAIFKDGATTLEKVIIKEFYRTLDLPYVERERFDFEERISLGMQDASSSPRGRESL